MNTGIALLLLFGGFLIVTLTMIDNPHHVFAACGANEKGDSGPSSFGANIERVLRGASTTEKYITAGSLRKEIIAIIVAS